MHQEIQMRKKRTQDWNLLDLNQQELLPFKQKCWNWLGSRLLLRRKKRQDILKEILLYTCMCGYILVHSLGVLIAILSLIISWWIFKFFIMFSFFKCFTETSRKWWFRLWWWEDRGTSGTVNTPDWGVLKRGNRGSTSRETGPSRTPSWCPTGRPSWSPSWCTSRSEWLK